MTIKSMHSVIKIKNNVLRRILMLLLFIPNIIEALAFIGIFGLIDELGNYLDEFKKYWRNNE